jgi:type I restriction enzyme M protein
LDCVFESTKDGALKEHAKHQSSGDAQGASLDQILKRKTGKPFYNTNAFNLPGLLTDQNHIRQNPTAYIGEFSADARDVFERFKFVERIVELDDKDLLLWLIQKFSAIDL